MSRRTPGPRARSTTPSTRRTSSTSTTSSRRTTEDDVVDDLDAELEADPAAALVEHLDSARPHARPRTRGRRRRPTATPRLRELWKDFKATGDQRLRERLILHYSPLVKYVAGRVGVGLPPNIEQADLVSYGIFGLIDAIEKFDLERAIKFETYAINRIRGAIIDELRSIDWIPRSVR